MYNFQLKWGNKQVEVGKNKKILVNQLIGTNGDIGYYNAMKKIDMWNESEHAPDIITDVSVGESSLLKYILDKKIYIACSVPIYAFYDCIDIKEYDLIDHIHWLLICGVKIITIHCTPTYELIELSKFRIVPCTSRGGQIVIQDMIRNKKQQNIFLKCFDEILRLCCKYDAAISIGTSFRPANIIDSLDSAQLKELTLQQKLASYAKSRGVNVILEMPGHMSPKKIDKLNTFLEKNIFPIMPLGPVVTDIGVGRDHITSAIGLTILGLKNNVQIISAMTAEEHTGNIPSLDSTKEAVEVARLVAHIIDMERFNDYSRDIEYAKSRTKSCICNSDKDACIRCGTVCPLRYEIH